MYNVVIPKSVAKQIKKLPAKTRNRVLDALDQLRENPRPLNSKKLVGQGLFRIRVGDYRLIYAVDDPAQLVILARVGHRREVYR